MPFKSQKQRAKCYALRRKGMGGSWDCDEWQEHTPDALPVRLAKQALLGNNGLGLTAGMNLINPAAATRPRPQTPHMPGAKPLIPPANGPTAPVTNTTGGPTPIPLPTTLKAAAAHLWAILGVGEWGNGGSGGGGGVGGDGGISGTPDTLYPTWHSTDIVVHASDELLDSEKRGAYPVDLARAFGARLGRGAAVAGDDVGRLAAGPRLTSGAVLGKPAPWAKPPVPLTPQHFPASARPPGLGVPKPPATPTAPGGVKPPTPPTASPAAAAPAPPPPPAGGAVSPAAVAPPPAGGAAAEVGGGAAVIPEAASAVRLPYVPGSVRAPGNTFASQTRNVTDTVAAENAARQAAGLAPMKGGLTRERIARAIEAAPSLGLTGFANRAASMIRGQDPGLIRRMAAHAVSGGTYLTTSPFRWMSGLQPLANVAGGFVRHGVPMTPGRIAASGGGVAAGLGLPFITGMPGTVAKWTEGNLDPFGTTMRGEDGRLYAKDFSSPGAPLKVVPEEAQGARGFFNDFHERALKAPLNTADRLIHADWPGVAREVREGVNRGVEGVENLADSVYHFSGASSQQQAAGGLGEAAAKTRAGNEDPGFLPDPQSQDEMELAAAGQTFEQLGQHLLELRDPSRASVPISPEDIQELQASYQAAKARQEAALRRLEQSAPDRAAKYRLAKATPEDVAKAEALIPKAQADLMAMKADPAFMQEYEAFQKDPSSIPSDRVKVFQAKSRELSDAATLKAAKSFPSTEELAKAVRSRNPMDPVNAPVIEAIEQDIEAQGYQPDSRSVMQRFQGMPVPVKLLVLGGLSLGVAGLLGGSMGLGAAGLLTGVLALAFSNFGLSSALGLAQGPKAPPGSLPGSVNADQIGSSVYAPIYQALESGTGANQDPAQVNAALVALHPQALDQLVQKNPALQPLAAKAIETRRMAEAYKSDRTRMVEAGRQAARQQAASLREEALKAGLPDPSNTQALMSFAQKYTNNPAGMQAELSKFSPESRRAIRQLIVNGLSQKGISDPYRPPNWALKRPEYNAARTALNALNALDN